MRLRKGFRRLAGDIFGKNKGARKIAMTAPVAEVATGEPEWARYDPPWFLRRNEILIEVRPAGVPRDASS